MGTVPPLPPEVAVTQATSLLDWVALYVSQPRDGDTAHDNERGPCVSLALQILLQRAFPMLCDDVQAGERTRRCDEWGVVLNVLEQFYEVPLGIDRAQLPSLTSLADDDTITENPALIQLLEFTLGAVVQCEDKATFVRDIMTMSDAVQVDLMAVIEKVMGLQSNSQVDNGTVNHEEAREPPSARCSRNAPSDPSHAAAQIQPSPQRGPTNDMSQHPSPRQHSPLHLSRNAELERAKRENEFLKDENVHMSRELQDTVAKLRQQESNNHTLVETIQQLKLQLDVDVLKRERSTRAMYDDRILVLERDLESATADLHAKTAIANEVSGLRDEVDLLRPVAEKVAKMEAAMAKYKVKIEELASVKEKLRRIEDANAELTEKNLSLEAQLSKAASLQRKLKEAKDTNTAVEFRVSELEALLSRQESELTRMRDDWEASQSSLREANALNLQLQKTVDEQRDADKAGDAFPPSADALAEGISEFNPELMQKLARLKFENQELRKQVNGETSERIDGLLDEIGDLTRLKKSFEARYFDTEQQLNRKSEEFVQATQQIAALEETLSSLQGAMSDMTENRNSLSTALEKASRRNAMLQEDVDAHKVERRAAFEEKRRLEGLLQECETRCSIQDQTILSQDAEVKALQDSLNRSESQAESLSLQLDDRNHCIEDLTARISHLEAQVLILESEKADLLTLVSSTQEKLTSRSDELAAMAALFGSTFEMKEELEELLRKTRESSALQLAFLQQQRSDELRLVKNNYDTRLSDERSEHQDVVEELRKKTSALESAHSDSLSRMTVIVNAKAIQIEELKSRMQEMSDTHANAMLILKTEFSERRKALEESNLVLQMEMDKYVEQHSVSNADRDTKESELISRISSLEKTLSDEKVIFFEESQILSAQVRQLEASMNAMRAHSDAQETKLKATVKSQLNSNHHLIETNQVLKSELKRKTAAVAQLENTVTRLESKVLLLEKERVHISNQEERKREVEEEETSFSSQLSTQVGLVITELEKLQKEHKELRQRVNSCQCHHNSSDTASMDNTKKYYLDRIRQLEQVKQQEEDKRRELLLVNAKLIQEQKQFQTKNAAMVNELQQLREKMNSWLLRDERRRKDEEIMRRKLQTLESKYYALVTKQTTERAQTSTTTTTTTIATSKTNETSEVTEAVDTNEVDDCSTSDEVGAVSSKQPLAARTDEADNNHVSLSHEDQTDENLSPNVSVYRKRKLEDDDMTKAAIAAEGQGSETDTSKIALSEATMKVSSVDVDSTRQATAKRRRASLFMTSRLQSNPPPADEEKPSECQQQ